MSITITSSNFIFVSLFGCNAIQESNLCSLILSYIKSNYIVSTVKKLAADDMLIFIAICENFTWKIKLTFKSKSEWTSIHYVIQTRFELGSKSYISMQNDKIIPLTNLFQHLLSVEILPE